MRIRRSLLPPKLPEHELKPTLVVDMDQTLLYYNKQSKVTRARPGVRQFLKRMSELYEIVVFTAASKMHADRALQYVDRKGQFITHRLYRDSCTVTESGRVKELALLGRDIRRVVTLDDCPLSYSKNPENAIPLPPYFGNDPFDSHLLHHIPLLEHIASHPDLVLALHHNMDQEFVHIHASAQEFDAMKE